MAPLGPNYFGYLYQSMYSDPILLNFKLLTHFSFEDLYHPLRAYLVLGYIEDLEGGPLL